MYIYEYIYFYTLSQVVLHIFFLCLGSPSWWARAPSCSNVDRCVNDAAAQVFAADFFVVRDDFRAYGLGLEVEELWLRIWV
jgi:hypothetical protein